MKKLFLLFVLAFVLAVPQRSIAQSTEDKVRIVGAGIEVIGKAIDNEINSRKEREKKEQEIRRKNEEERRINEERRRQERQTAAREREEREHRAYVEWWEAKENRGKQLQSQDYKSLEDVWAGRKDFRTHNFEQHILTDYGSNYVYLMTDRGEKITMSVNEMDSDRDFVFKISYYQNGDYCSISGQNIYFQKVEVWIRYNNDNWDRLFCGSRGFSLRGQEYKAKLSTAFPIPSNKSISVYDIKDIEILFEGGQVTTCY